MGERAREPLLLYSGEPCCTWGESMALGLLWICNLLVIEGDASAECEYAANWLPRYDFRGEVLVEAAQAKNRSIVLQMLSLPSAQIPQMLLVFMRLQFKWIPIVFRVYSTPVKESGKKNI